jgi:hypothetical protein
MSATKIWNGTAWVDLSGPQGPEGPTVASTDAGNLCKLGSDGKLLVAQADLDPLYVRVDGDTMTGALTTPELTVEGNITSTGAAHSFAAGSIESTAVGPLHLVEVDSDYTLGLSDAGKVICAGSPSFDIRVTIPNSAVADFPVGTIIEVVDDSEQTVSIAADGGVVLAYSVGFAGSYYRRGGEAGVAYLSGVLCSAKIVKRGQDYWWVVGNVSDAVSPKQAG